MREIEISGNIHRSVKYPLIEERCWRELKRDCESVTFVRITRNEERNE